MTSLNTVIFEGQGDSNTIFYHLITNNIFLINIDMLFWYLIKQNSWKIISLRNISGYGCNNGSLRKERGALSVQWWCYGEHLSVIASEACEQLLQSWYGLYDHYVHQHCPGSYKRHSGQSSGSFWLAEASRSKACRKYGEVMQHLIPFSGNCGYWRNLRHSLSSNSTLHPMVMEWKIY